MQEVESNESRNQDPMIKGLSVEQIVAMREIDVALGNDIDTIIENYNKIFEEPVYVMKD